MQLKEILRKYNAMEGLTDKELDFAISEIQHAFHVLKSFGIQTTLATSFLLGYLERFENMKYYRELYKIRVYKQ